MGRSEAGQSLPCGVHLFGVLRFGGALGHLGARLGGVTALAQLQHQVINVEALGLVEQAHLGEHARDVAMGLLVVGERPRLVLGDLLLGDVQRLDALVAVLEQILLRLDLPFVGDDLCDLVVVCFATKTVFQYSGFRCERMCSGTHESGQQQNSGKVLHVDSDLVFRLLCFD